MTERNIGSHINEINTNPVQETEVSMHGDMMPGVDVTLKVAAAMNVYSSMKNRDGIDPELVGNSMQHLLESINSDEGLAALKKLSSDE